MTNKNKSAKTGPPLPPDAGAATVRTRGRWRLRSYLVALVAAVCAPLFAFQIYDIARELRERHAQAATVSFHVARTIAGEVSQFVRATDRGLAFLSARPKVRALDPADCDPTLKILQAARERIANVLTVDRDGTLVCSAAGVDPARPQQVDPKYWLNRLRETGQPVIGSPARGFVTGLWVVTMAYALRDDSGKVIGAAAMAMDLARFQFGQEGLQAPEGTTITIVTGEGVVIARSAEGEAWLGKNVADNETVRAVLAKRSGTLRSEGFDGIERDYGFAPVAGTEWVVLAGIPAAAAKAEVRETILAVSYAAALTFFVAVFLAWLVARRMSPPVKDLATVAGRIAAGDDSVRAPVAGPTEFAEVATQFNRMLDTQRSQQQALRQSEERYRDLIENSQDLICTHDLEGRLLSVNAAAVRLTGYSREALLSMNIADLLTRGAQDSFAAYLAEIRTKRAARGLMRIRTADGKTRWWEYDNTLRIEGVEAPAVRGMAQDITERKRLEATLRESEERFRCAFENAPVGMCLVAADGRFLKVNGALCRMLGYSESELLAKTFLDATHPDDVIPSDESVRRLLAGKATSFELEKRYLYAAGHIVWGRVRSSLMRKPDGSPLFFITHVQDITERKQSDNELQTSRKQLRVLAARLSTAREEETTSLAREIHDELGQALTGLKMDLSWLASRLGQDRRALKKKAESMTELVDTTIDRVRSIATRLRPKMLDDLGLVAAIEWQAQEFRKRAGVKCEVVSSVDIAKMGQDVSSAVFRITQEALTNIARHAAATRADISLYEESGWLILEVRDNGNGIRVEEITADKSIGLLGMRERALAVGGELTISGFPGRGTVATLRIPFPAP